MQPGIDLRMRTMIKALAEVVMPAIDPANRMAMEQAGVILGSMTMLREQIDYAHWYEVTELSSLLRLAIDLKRIAGLDLPAELTTAIDTGTLKLRRSDLRLSQLREANVSLREAISLSVEAAYAHPRQEILKAVQSLVLEHSHEQLGRERAYVAGTKWDGFPESLQSIEASLRKSAT